MKKLFVLLFFTSTLIATACDVCNTFDYSQDQNNTFIGLFRRYSFSSGYLNTPSLLNFSFNNPKKRHGGNTQNYFVNKTGSNYENSLTHELFINKNFNNKFLLQFRLPLVKNQTYLSEVTPRGIGIIGDTLIETHGLGDASIGLNIIKIINKEHITHRINYGVGIQIPTGKHNTFTENDFVDVRHAPGTGSWSFSPSVQYYNSVNKKYGISAQALYSRSTKRKKSVTSKAGSGFVGNLSGDYRFGDVFSTQAQLYYAINAQMWKVIPKIGMVYTHEAKDYFLNNEVITSGSKLTELILTTDIRRENIGLRIQYLHPIYQDINEDLVFKNGAYQVGVYYTFEQKNIIKNKTIN